MPLGAGGEFAIDAVGGMEIDGPAAERDGVGVGALFHHVLLPEDVVAFKAAALAFSGNRADPFERQVFGLWKTTGVFDVVPHTIGDLPELPLDGLRVVDGVHAATPFEPPEAAARIGGADIAIVGNLRDVAKRVRGRHVSNGPAGILAVQVERVAAQFAVGVGRANPSPNSSRDSAPMRNAAPAKGDDAIARGVAEERRLYSVRVWFCEQ